MKKLLQLLIISSSLLLVFSCSGDGTVAEEGSSALQETWTLKSITSYASDSCSDTPIYEYNTSGNSAITIDNRDDCLNLDSFFSATNGAYVSACLATVDDDGDSTCDIDAGVCTTCPDIDTDGVCDELDLCEGLSNIDTDGDGICNEIDPCIGYDNENDDDDDGVCNDYDPCIGSSNIDTDGDGICNDQEVEGCNDPNACNYDPDATDEGECIYVEEFYDCDGSCIAEIDCSGECGGDSFIDDCGECVSGDTPSDDCLGIQIPQNFYLNQNYPNPFNPFTSIEYGTPNPDNIKIILYDVIGRKINILIDKFHQPGYYELTLSSEKLNSGIYILRLISSKKVLTRKIAVVK